MSFQLIESERANVSVSRMCRLLGVSRSGYYSWRDREPSPRALEDRELEQEIEAAHRSSRGTYGSPRIREELASTRPGLGRRRIARLMRGLGLRGLPARRFRRAAGSSTDGSFAANVLDRAFRPPNLNEVWAGDLTYLWTQEGWLYLAVTLDLCSRRVLGWSFASQPDTSVTVAALEMAVTRRGGEAASLHHSDRGCQYASSEYQARLRHHGITPSMSRRGNCWDNAPVESFFSTLKRELVNRSRWATRPEAQTDVYEYIEAFYNRRRRHSSLGWSSPADFEKTLTLRAS